MGRASRAALCPGLWPRLPGQPPRELPSSLAMCAPPRSPFPQPSASWARRCTRVGASAPGRRASLLPSWGTAERCVPAARPVPPPRPALPCRRTAPPGRGSPALAPNPVGTCPPAPLPHAARHERAGGAQRGDPARHGPAQDDPCRHHGACVGGCVGGWVRGRVGGPSTAGAAPALWARQAGRLRPGLGRARSCCRARRAGPVHARRRRVMPMAAPPLLAPGTDPAGPGRRGLPQLHGQRVWAPGWVGGWVGDCDIAAWAGNDCVEAGSPAAVTCCRRSPSHCLLLLLLLLHKSTAPPPLTRTRVARLPARGQRLVLPLLPPPVGAWRARAAGRGWSASQPARPAGGAAPTGVARPGPHADCG